MTVDLLMCAGAGATPSPGEVSNYLAVSFWSSPSLCLYAVSGTAHTKMAHPAGIPANAAAYAASADGSLLVAGEAALETLQVYRRVDESNSFVSISPPMSFRTVDRVDMAGNGSAFLLSVRNPLREYHLFIVEGDTVTEVPGPSTALTLSSASISFDGTYLLTRNTSHQVHVYKRTGNSYGLVSTMAGSGVIYGTTISPDNDYLTISHSASPFLRIYKRAGDLFTYLPGAAQSPARTIGVTRFSPNGEYLYAGSYTQEAVSVYKRTGDSFAKLTDLTNVPDAPYRVEVSQDGNYIAVAGDDISPYVATYLRSGDTHTKLANLPGIPASPEDEGDGPVQSIIYYTIPTS